MLEIVFRLLVDVRRTKLTNMSVSQVLSATRLVPLQVVTGSLRVFLNWVRDRENNQAVWVQTLVGITLWLSVNPDWSVGATARCVHLRV